MTRSRQVLCIMIAFAFLGSTGYADDPPTFASRALRAMESAEKALATDAKTAGEHQRTALNQLDELIKRAKRDSSSGDPTMGMAVGKPKEPRNMGEKPAITPKKGMSDEKNPGGVPGDSASGKGTTPDGGTGTPKPAMTAAQIQIKHRDAVHSWGRLPDTVRERMLNANNEKALPGSQDLVRRYFEALLQRDR